MQAPPCKKGAYDGHAVQAVAPEPLHVEQLLSHARQMLLESAYEPGAQFTTQLAPWRKGLLDVHVTQSVEAPPVQVVQSAWQLPQPPTRSYSPSGHDEMQSLL